MSLCLRHGIIGALLLTAPSICSAQIYIRFAVTNRSAELSTIQTTGAASQHVLNISVRTNGRITGTGKHYNIKANAVSIADTNVVRVRVLTNSKLGTPVVTTRAIGKVTNEIIVPPPPFSVAQNPCQTESAIISKRSCVVRPGCVAF